MKKSTQFKSALAAFLVGAVICCPAAANEEIVPSSKDAPSLVLQSQGQASSVVVETARSFLGTPYVWGGVTASGFDCSGYVQEVMRLNGYSVPRLADIQFEKSHKVTYENLKAGDMVFFSTYLPGASHCGFYLGGGEFIHASSAGKKVIISQMRTGYYRQRFVGGGRPEGWNGDRSS